METMKEDKQEILNFQSIVKFMKLIFFQTKMLSKFSVQKRALLY